MTAIANTQNTQGNSFGHPKPRSGSWKAAFLAGLPHILMGLLIGTDKFLTTVTTSSQTMSMVRIRDLDGNGAYQLCNQAT
jgi:hypothetical protein